jgi:hypothetical protein
MSGTWWASAATGLRRHHPPLAGSICLGITTKKPTMKHATVNHPVIGKLIRELEGLAVALHEAEEPRVQPKKRAEQYRAVAARLGEVADLIQDLRREIQTRFPVAAGDSRRRARRASDG